MESPQEREYHPIQQTILAVLDDADAEQLEAKDIRQGVRRRGYTLAYKQLVHHHLDVLLEEGDIERVHTGVYQLADDGGDAR